MGIAIVHTEHGAGTGTRAFRPLICVLKIARFRAPQWLRGDGPEEIAGAPVVSMENSFARCARWRFNRSDNGSRVSGVFRHCLEYD
jgi:hypothetical protein